MAEPESIDTLLEELRRVCMLGRELGARRIVVSNDRIEVELIDAPAPRVAIPPPAMPPETPAQATLRKRQEEWERLEILLGKPISEAEFETLADPTRLE